MDSSGHGGKKADSIGVDTLQLGVWRVSFTRNAAFDVHARWQKFKAIAPTIQHLTSDFLNLAPVLFPCLCLAMVVQQVKGIVLWHLFSRVALLIEVGLLHGRFDRVAIGLAVGARIAFTVSVAALSCWSRKAECTMQNRIIHHFDELEFALKAKADPHTAQEMLKDHDDLSSTNVWYAYRDLLIASGRGLAILGQLYYITTHVRTTTEAAIYIVLLLVKPLTKDILEKSLWEKSWIATSTEPNFNRMQSLKTMVGKVEYKQELIANGCTQYLKREYRKARQRLGDTCSSYPATQYTNQERVEVTILSELLGELPLLYCFATAIFSSERFYLSNLVMLGNAGETITYGFDSILEGLTTAGNSLTSVKRTYDLVRTRNLPSGKLVNSLLGSKLGMGLEMRNTSFSYPGNKHDNDALHGVSFSIKPGQLVVVVGANGSGKSTLVKLLTRLYDCTAGEVLIDGKDIKEYKRKSLQAATALLTQDHHIYPLSLGENIGIGNPRLVNDELLLREAARKGRAAGLIEKYAEKYDTVLEPMAEKLMGYCCSSTDDTPLSKIYKTFEKKVDVSGGERQRVAASRTFMRLTSEKVKLVIADEPSSNLDPEGEWELFNNLLAERQGKTMIFITHRFGHLTKRADLILCMKNGQLVEEGTHDELLARHGEYFKLYEIQARAFASTN